MARIDNPVDVPEALGPLRKVLTRAGNPDPEARPDAGELAVGLLAAAEALDRPKPLPLAGTAASVDEVSAVDRDPTELPRGGDPTAAVDVAGSALRATEATAVAAALAAAVGAPPPATVATP